MNLPIVPRSQLEKPSLNWDGIPRHLHARYLHPGEPEALVALARSVGAKTMIEIGVNEGRTARLMLDNVPTLTEYIGVDVLPGYHTQCLVQRREIPVRPGWLASKDQRFRTVVSARGSLDLKVGDLPAADVVFIDGDHGDVAVRHDTALARACVRPGGLIIWHDYHDLGKVHVRDVLDEYAAQGAPIVHLEGTWIAFEKIR